jgi:hypothetical protein
MSIIAVLKVIAYGVIPLALAWAGDHLAADALKEEPRKRLLYRRFFALFAILGVALIVVVEKKIEDDHNAEVSEQKANLKTVLDKMTAMAENFNGVQQRLSLPAVVVRKFRVSPPTEEARLRQMSNADFRQYVLDWSKKLRDFDKQYMTEEGARFANMPRFGQDQLARDAFMSYWMAETIRTNTEHLNDYKNNFWGETNAVYNEIVFRYKTVGKTVPEPSAVMPFAIGGGILIRNTLNGALNGPHPIGELADYIEILARGLPN